MPKNRDTPIVPVANAAQIEQAVRDWLNTYTSKPKTVDYEYLRPDAEAITFSPIQVPFKVRQYIDGGYKAQYQFRVIYRTEAITNDERIAAVEILNNLAAWAVQNPPTFADATNAYVEQSNLATVIAAYEDGSADYAVTLTLYYEVI